jgi:branched-chain amino acid transport system permease protein
MDASILRQLLIALAMIGIMLMRPHGLWPAREHGKAAPAPTDGDAPPGGGTASGAARA